MSHLIIQQPYEITWAAFYPSWTDGEAERQQIYLISSTSHIKVELKVIPSYSGSKIFGLFMPAYQLHAVPSQTLWCLLQCSPFLLLSPLLSSLSLLFLPLLFLPHFILHFSFFAFPFPPFIPSFPSLAFFFILLLDIYN